MTINTHIRIGKGWTALVNNDTGEAIDLWESNGIDWVNSELGFGWTIESELVHLLGNRNDSFNTASRIYMNDDFEKPKLMKLSAEPTIHDNVLKFTRGKPYIIWHWRDKKRDSKGFRVFWFELYSGDGKFLDSVDGRSGTRQRAGEPMVHPKNDYSGSGRCLPEAVYDMSKLIYTGYNEPGVGYLKIRLDYHRLCRGINNRSQLLIHDDERYPGSMGCACTYKGQDNNQDGLRDIKTIEKWFKEYPELADSVFFSWNDVGYLNKEFGLTLNMLRGKV